MSRAAPPTANWYTSAADSLSSRCASSTTSSSPSPNASRAARNTAAVLPVSGTSIRWLNAANGTAPADAVPVTQPTRANRGPSRSAASRASDVLPTPAGPISTAPTPVAHARFERSSAGSRGAVTHSTGTAGVLAISARFSTLSACLRAEIVH